MNLRSRSPGSGRKTVALGSTVAVVAATMFGGSAAYADDGSNGDAGKPVLKSISHDSQDPTLEGFVDESEHAFTGSMKFYRPAQAADGTVYTDGSEGLPYYNVDGELVETRTHAKPLINVFHKGPFETVDGYFTPDDSIELGFIGHGLRDAYAAVSLDDGITWKSTNLSESAAESSSIVEREDVGLFQTDDLATYPGDVVNIFHAIAGNKVLVAWPSRYCDQGQPAYSLDNEQNVEQRAAIAAYLGIDLTNPSPDDLYLLDMYGVAGQHGSVDYLDDKWEQNYAVGEVPFSCLWTARGELVDGDDPRTEALEQTYMRWFNTERLTSGRRDVNRIETMGVAGAGFAITWQEDPEGLRPGQGEGPGAGWSGAIANSGTDVWYSYIDWEDFDVVQDPADATGVTPMTFADYTDDAYADTTVTQKPKPFVPMAMPMRITDNAKCNVANPAPYCYGEAIEGMGVPVPEDDSGIQLDPRNYGLREMCSDIVEVETGKHGDLSMVCITEDGLPLLGNTAITRPRLNLFGYDSSGNVKDATIDSAFAIVVGEEDKGVGKFGLVPDENGLPTAEPCTPVEHDPSCLPFDEGKNQWYFSFSMSLTDQMAKHKTDGLPANLGFHGNMLNQPEVNWMTGEFFEPADTTDMWDFGDYNYELYNTEIARRGSLLAQDIAKVHVATSNAKSGLLALPTWKQGTMNQGGPADVMSRRIVLPKGWRVDQGNPYAFRNMQCTTWAFKGAANPYYPEGVCLDSAVNVSATVPTVVMDTDTDALVNPGDPMFPTLDFGQGTTFGILNMNPILQGAVQGEGNTSKMLQWHQCPYDARVVSRSDATVAVDCESDWRPDADTTRDQSWYNPLDVGKGHRGFLDGDFVMMLYGWSPNWRLNAKGSDRNELYIKRSFTGAATWTTLPTSFTDITGVKYNGDGTTTCETFRSLESQTSGDKVEPRICNGYAAGAAEQARNVTQHQSMRITTLDPRYAMTGGPFGVGITEAMDPFGSGYAFTEEDTRDPSRYFIVYETGDNTTVIEGEAEPLDLFYSRAVNFGDDYQVWAEETDTSVCYPSDPHEDTDVPLDLVGSGFCNEFDQMEQGRQGLEASEASLWANPGGEFLYGTWTQVGHDPVEADAMARRVWWIDDYISDTFGWHFGQGSGDGTPAPE